LNPSAAAAPNGRTASIPRSARFHAISVKNSACCCRCCCFRDRIYCCRTNYFLTPRFFPVAIAALVPLLVGRDVAQVRYLHIDKEEDSANSHRGCGHSVVENEREKSENRSEKKTGNIVERP